VYKVRGEGQAVQKNKEIPVNDKMISGVEFVQNKPRVEIMKSKETT